MRLPIRGRRESEGRVVAIEDSTLVRAGEAATRLALEETLLRRGWRVLFLDDQFGPLFGPQRPKLFEGIAVRLRPGSADKVELRLVHVESDTLEAPGELIERVKRAARSATVEWLVAAFDGESMRVVPELDEIESAAARPSPPPAAESLPLRPAPPPLPVAAPPARRPSPAAAATADARDLAVRAASGRRRRPRGRSEDAPAAAASSSGGRASSRANRATEAGSGGGRRGGASSGGARAGSPASSAAPEEASGSGPDAAAKRSRRRGKRGGRRRSGRSTAS